jgi:WD40 repeat protein
VPKPTWHAPWKLKAVLAGHLGWVRCVAFEPGNQWFVTGAADRTIKVNFEGKRFGGVCDIWHPFVEFLLKYLACKDMQGR